MTKRIFLWLGLLLYITNLYGHPMPGSVITLSVLEQHIRGEVSIPLIELGNAVGDSLTANVNDPYFVQYFLQHIGATSGNDKWTTAIDTISITTDNDEEVGSYQEVLVKFRLIPPDESYLRSFSFNYNAVIHQVVTHSAIVYITEDWNNGIHTAHEATQLGVISVDVHSGKLYPLQINLQKGSWWQGIKSMFSLGMQHIKEGTDHLLFLIVLLLPAPLVTDNKHRWAQYGGLKYSLLRLLKIVTAFTAGHSITLLAGALGYFHLPSQFVEILIAGSILVSAIHAIRPLFPGKELFIAGGFGCIHGLAFATVLSGLELSTGKLILSICSFNLGIEYMQLLIMAAIVPWLLLAARTTAYQYMRITGALLAGIAAAGWMMERCSGKTNIITAAVEYLSQYSIEMMITLAIFAVALYTYAAIQKKIGWAAE
jgi:hypothetical protein